MNMKTIIIAAIAFVMGTASVHATIRCEPSPGGALCCWDIDQKGPFKPINC